MNIGRTIVTIIMSTVLLAGCGTIPNRSLSSARFTDMIAPTRDSLIVQNKQPLTLPAGTYVPTASSMPDTALRQAAGHRAGGHVGPRSRTANFSGLDKLVVQSRWQVDAPTQTRRQPLANGDAPAPG
jgi:hypothetical protein